MFLPLTPAGLEHHGGGNKEERITGTLLFSCPGSAGIAEGRFLGRMKLEEPKESQCWPRISSQPREGQGQSPGQRQAPSVEGAEGGEQEPAASLVNTHHLHTRETRKGKGRGDNAVQKHQGKVRETLTRALFVQRVNGLLRDGAQRCAACVTGMPGNVQTL